MSMTASESINVLTVLVIDDDIDMRTLVRAMLTPTADLCWHVEEAARGLDGLEAFDRLRAAGQPCVLVVDLQMPDLDGFQLAQLVLERAPHQAMILFTGYCTDAVRDHARRVGFAATLRKTDVHDLPGLVASLLPGKHAAAAAASKGQ